MHASSSMLQLKSNISDQGKTELYPVSKITVLFSIWHIFPTYLNNSIKLIWNYTERKGPMSISLTLLAHLWKNWQLEAKRSSRKFSYVRELCHDSWRWSECWHSINTLEGFVRNLCCTFSKLSKQLGFGEKYFCCSSRGYSSMHARWSSFKTILGQSTFSKLVQFAIFGCKCLIAWASAGFFQGGSTTRLLQNFFKGGLKVVKFLFSYLKLRKQLFCWNFQSPGGAEVLPCPPFRRPCVIVIQMLESFQKVNSFPQHIFVWIWILYPSAGENKKSKATRLCRRS